MVSEAAYYFTNLVSAESFIENLNAASLSMDEKEFEKKMILARESLRRTTNLPHGSISPNTSHSAESLEGQTKVPKVGFPSVSSNNTSMVSLSKLQADGSSALIAADKVGQLAREFPFLYASVGDLRIEDVESLLNDYKELVLKYYSLCKTIEKMDTNKVVSNDHEHASDVQVVSDDGPLKQDRLKVPENDELKESIEESSNKRESLSADESSVEMADKNVILVNESSNAEFSLDVFQEQISREVVGDNTQGQQDLATTVSMHSQAE